MGKPWKHHPMARTCKYCGSQRPGMQPFTFNGKRGYWHLKCFENARTELRNENVAEPLRTVINQISECYIHIMGTRTNMTEQETEFKEYLERRTNKEVLREWDREFNQGHTEFAAIARQEALKRNIANARPGRKS